MKKITKSRLKEIYHKVDNRVINYINKLDANEIEVTTDHPKVILDDNRDYTSLIDAARKYDIDDFFVLSKDKTKRQMKARYKILLKGYQGIRNGGVAAVKKVYKLRYDR